MPLLYIIYRFIWQLKKKNQDLLIKLINRWLKLLNQVGIKQQLHEHIDNGDLTKRSLTLITVINRVMMII